MREGFKRMFIMHNIFKKDLSDPCRFFSCLAHLHDSPAWKKGVPVHTPKTSTSR